MPSVILGLDVGGANLKAATSDRRAAAVPFALWREPDRLPAVLAELVGRFPDAEQLAVTMTGELCDCFRTKRDGVNHILTAVLNVSRSRPVWVWSTGGKFLNTEEARTEYLKVASANWHALATYCAEYVPRGPAILIDIGTTTTDIIPISNGVPVPQGQTDGERLYTYELIYTGWRRTPVCAILGFDGAAELFATMHDAYLLVGMVPEDPADTDTADHRPATQENAHARLSRMVGGDPELTEADVTRSLAEGVIEQQVKRIKYGVSHAAGKLELVHPSPDKGPFGLNGRDEDYRNFNDFHTLMAVMYTPLIFSGSGEFLARHVFRERGQMRETRGNSVPEDVFLSERLGPELSTCAAAYAVAAIASERPSLLRRVIDRIWPKG